MFSDHAQVEQIVKQDESLERVNECVYLEQLLQTNPSLEPVIIKLIRLSWSVFGKQGYTEKHSIVVVKAKDSHLVHSSRRDIWIRDMDTDKISGKEIEQCSKSNGEVSVRKHYI